LDDPEYVRLDSEINSRKMLIAKIFVEVDDVLAAQFNSVARYSWGHSTEIEPTELLLGILKRQDEADAIFGPKGPQLSAQNLHPWIWNAAVDLWDDEHYSNAVVAASAELFDVKLPAKLRISRSGGATDRITKAFSTSPPTASEPRLRFSEFTMGTPDWTSAHEGAVSFGRGCAQGIRNVTTHGASPGEQLALEALAALSLLARWVDEATIETVP
jgi:hypothetical protein